VRGFWETPGYEDILLEACAFELEHSYLLSEKALDVEAEVRLRLNL
jgi:hypothetical protein